MIRHITSDCCCSYFDHAVMWKISTKLSEQIARRFDVYSNYKNVKMIPGLKFGIQSTQVFYLCIDATRLNNDYGNKSELCTFVKLGDNLYIKIALIQSLSPWQMLPSFTILEHKHNLWHIMRNVDIKSLYIFPYVCNMQTTVESWLPK